MRKRVSLNPWLWSWGTLASIAAVVAAIWSAVVTVDARFTKQDDFDRHMTAEEVRNAAQDKEVAINVRRQQLQTLQLRAWFMEDQVYNLAARKQVLGPKFTVSDEVSLQRYKTEYDKSTARVDTIRRQIEEMTRPK